MIYENICKLAKERGISINKLEEKANVSTGSICKWGNSVSPTVKNIKKVADILKCTVDELISGSEKWGEESVQLATTIISTVSVVCNIYLIFYIRKMN